MVTRASSKTLTLSLTDYPEAFQEEDDEEEREGENEGLV